MLRRQRTFFLANNQYEPVVLELVRVRNGYAYFTFRKDDQVTGYAMYHRVSLDSAQTWETWQRTDLQLTTDPAEFSFYTGEGYMCEVYIVVTGDGSKQPSEPSNTITAVVPKEPAVSPPQITAQPFYYNGKPYPVIVHSYLPNGVSRWVLWARQLGETDWVQLGVKTGGVVSAGTDFSIGVPYQFLTAWVNNDATYIISDISNIATITLYDTETRLLPPIILPREVELVEPEAYPGTYYLPFDMARGDMRAKKIFVEYKRSTTGVWVGNELTLSDVGVSDAAELYAFSQFIGNASQIIEGEEWQFRITNRATGVDESVYSNIRTITMPSLLPRLDTPTMHLNQSGTTVIVSWDAVENAVGYKVERRLSDETSFTVLSDSLPSTMTHYNDTGRTYGDSYVYHVTALANEVNFKHSRPAEDSITVRQEVILQPPVISNLAESGIDITMTISNLDGANSRTVYVEMSENGGAWRQVAFGNVASAAVTAVNVTVDGWKINGGELRFRAYQLAGGAAQHNSDYSEIVSITIDEREWLLRWNGTSWDDPSGLTGGWINQTVTWSDETEVSNITETTPETGVKRLQGQGWYRTVNPIIENQGNLLTKYSRIYMIGSLVKQADGTSNHAWFGVAFTYPFMGGKNFDTRNGTYVYAGGESGRASAGTKVDPYFSPRASSSYAGKQGPYLFFRLHSGYADIKGIFAIKR